MKNWLCIVVLLLASNGLLYAASAPDNGKRLNRTRQFAAWMTSDKSGKKVYFGYQHPLYPGRTLYTELEVYYEYGIRYLRLYKGCLHSCLLLDGKTPSDAYTTHIIHCLDCNRSEFCLQKRRDCTIREAREMLTDPEDTLNQAMALCRSSKK